jgi:hypothetical protein
MVALLIVVPLVCALAVDAVVLLGASHAEMKSGIAAAAANALAPPITTRRREGLSGSTGVKGVMALLLAGSMTS